MGICVACFERDIAGAVGFHRAALVQYMRPEIIGFVLGSLAAALAFKEFRPRGGSAPIVRGRTQKLAPAAGWVLPAVFAALFVLMLIYPRAEGAEKIGILFYSVKGPGAMYAPLAVSVIAGLVIEFPLVF
ncbi:MAG: hypothetical protein R6U41_12000 [Desulfosalsimonas sp.]|uniref:hypothetical protein n=1 Tax=Desulfosalsimonas sp. TaxID=3073848 RepID=UPI003970CFA5